jgi:hypothetical protein
MRLQCRWRNRVTLSSAGKWEKAVKGKHEKAEKERKKKSKGKGKEREVVVKQTKKVSTRDRSRSHSRGTASDMFKDRRRPGECFARCAY